MAIKVLTLDVYGTILSSVDFENQFPPRKGLDELLDYCDKNGIKVITGSDACASDIHFDFKKAGINTQRFSGFFRMTETPKEFGEIIEYYKIRPEELLIVGDSQLADIAGAENVHARYHKVPKYTSTETRELFDFRQVIRML